MADQDRASPAGQAKEDLASGGPRPTGFATVARRISTFTTNCLVSVLILVGGLGVGRQVLRWWAEGDVAQPLPTPSAGDRFADPSAVHDLEFGSHGWAISRREITADARQAMAQLRSDAARKTQQAALPDDPLTPAERELLDRLATEKPVLEQAGEWQIHEFAGPFPMVAGTRRIVQTPAEPGGRKLAGPPRRVVSWGLGIPLAENEYTLYTFHCIGSHPRAVSTLPEIPLPPGAARTLAMRAEGGGAVIGFEGSRETETWKRFFEQWFRRNGWTVAEWRRSGAAWHLRGEMVRAGQKPVTVDIHFGPRPEGRWEGILVVTHASAPIEKDAHP